MEKSTLFYLSIFLWLVPKLALAQSATNPVVSDSIKLIIAKEQNDTIKYGLINKYAFALIFKDPDNFENFIQPYLESASKKKFYLGEADLYNTKGIYFAVFNKVDSAFWAYNNAINIASENKLLLIKAKAYNNIGLYYWNSSKPSIALDFFLKSLALKDSVPYSIENEKFKATDFSNIGLIYQEINNFDKAIEYHKKTISLRIQFNNLNYLPNSYNNLGICYKSKQIKDSAIYYFKMGLSAAKQADNSIETHKINYNLGNLYLEQGSLNLAIEHFRQTIHENTQNKDLQKTNINAYVGLLACHIQLNNIREATHFSHKAKQLLEIYPEFKLSCRSFFKENAELNFLKGDFLEGRKNLLKYTAFTDSVFSNANAKEIANLETLFNVKENEKQLLIVKARTQALENEKLFVQNELIKSKNDFLMLLVSGSMLLFGFLALYFYLRRKNEKKRNLELLKIKDQNIIAVINAQEEERKKIAKELHDGIVQDITAIMLKLKTNDFHVSNICNMLEKVSNETREISHQMMPLALREFGLINALEDIFEKILLTSNIKYEFIHDNFEQRLPEKIEISIFRIIQELLNNIIKHSQASEVFVNLSQLKGKLVLILEDNGIGFNSEKVNKGIGLNSLDSRVKIVNGEIKFEQGSKSGTITYIRIPIG